MAQKHDVLFINKLNTFEWLENCCGTCCYWKIICFTYFPIITHPSFFIYFIPSIAYSISIIFSYYSILLNRSQSRCTKKGLKHVIIIHWSQLLSSEALSLAVFVTAVSFSPTLCMRDVWFYNRTSLKDEVLPVRPLYNSH